MKVKQLKYEALAKMYNVIAMHSHMLNNMSSRLGIYLTMECEMDLAMRDDPKRHTVIQNCYNKKNKNSINTHTSTMNKTTCS